MLPISSTIKKGLILSYFLLICSLLFAQENSSLLWKVSGNGTVHESYLFGTIHLICKDQFMMDEITLKALEDSDKLFMEIDMSDPGIMGKMNQISFNKDMENIKAHIPEEEHATVDAFFKESFGAGLDQLGAMKPFILSSMVLMKVISCPNVQSYEQFFLGKAQEKQIPIKGLETIEFQASLFDEIPLEEQIDELVKVILDTEKGNQEFQELVDVYLSKDIEYIHDQIIISDMFANHAESLLYNRNKAWIPIIEEAIKEASAFVAVGAGHLGSENGLVQLLRKQGYTVEPVLK
ncbi:hypothetical protein A33Q_2799 [Indibacter alkaliphilus LW1]|uniref:TraB/GumN family protein n=1 Tax=Indibacter alkaliphilus (strain CCUG 57479 / KCTC 22604 / LW1) TaxID=1189612 RepID=S2D898_INDAL|nr:TraB/GumN family protein [Indibacter alkaliphilus]EOZ95437.1 hypothetical protein A33Q_2799 [Indibacter alkaliphilus LW1]